MGYALTIGRVEVTFPSGEDICEAVVPTIEPEPFVASSDTPLGPSFSGRHIVETALTDPQVVATIVLCPLMDGLAHARTTALRERLDTAAAPGPYARQAQRCVVIGVPDEFCQQFAERRGTGVGRDRAEHRSDPF